MLEETMSFEDRLKVFQEKTDEMGSREARIGFFFRNNPTKEVGLLSETYCASVKTSRPRVYPDKQTRIPGMLATNRAIWSAGVVYFGGPSWYENKLEPGKYSRQPGKDFKPEGNLRDNKETNKGRNIAFNRARPVDYQLLTWGLEMFNEDNIRQREGILFPKVMPPTILVPVPMNKMSWLTLRTGDKLDKIIELIVNLKRYNANHEIEMCAPANGIITACGYGDYNFQSEDGPDGRFEVRIEDPSTLMQYYIERTFGAIVRVEMFRLFNQTTPVALDQTLYTPIKEQAVNPARKFTIAELRKMPCYDALQYMVALSCATSVAGMPYIDAELAYGDKEPLIQMCRDFPRVQRIHNIQEAFKSVGVAHNIDMLDVPHRVHMRKFRQLHEEERAAKAAIEGGRDGQVEGEPKG